MFTRDVSKLKPGRAGYGLLCYPDGKLLCDGVLLRLEQNRFWYVQADGPVYSWFIAHAQGLDVKISDPNSWVSQVQGPASLKILNALLDDGVPQKLHLLRSCRSEHRRTEGADLAHWPRPTSWDSSSSATERTGVQS